MEHIPAPIGEFLTIIIEAAITIAVPVLLKLLYMFVQEQVKKMRFVLGDAQMAQLRDMAAIVTSAMEKSAMSGWIKDEAQAKKSQAMKVLQDYVDSKGLNIPVSVIEAELEHTIHLGLHKVIEGDVIEYGDERQMGFGGQVTGIGVPVEGEEVEEPVKELTPASRLGFVRNR